MDLHPNDDLGHLWKFRNSTLRTSRPSRSVEIDSRLVSISSVASFAFVWGRLASCLTTMQWTMNTGFSVSFRKMSWSLSWHILQRLHVSFEIGACPSFRKTLWMNVWKWSWILAMYMRTWSTTPIGWLLACPAGMALLQAQTLTSRQRTTNWSRSCIGKRPWRHSSRSISFQRLKIFQELCSLPVVDEPSCSSFFLPWTTPPSNSFVNMISMLSRNSWWIGLLWLQLLPRRCNC